LNLNKLNEITTKEELSGLLNQCLKRIDTMKKNKGFSHAGNTDQTERKWLLLSDPVYGFFESCCSIKNGLFDVDGREVEKPGIERKTDLYKAFKDYCLREKLSPVKEGKFNKQLQEHAPNISEKRVPEGGQSVRCWRGIELKTKEEREEDRKSLFDYEEKPGKTAG
jgi:hypothetical protein